VGQNYGQKNSTNFISNMP